MCGCRRDSALHLPPAARRQAQRRAARRVGPLPVPVERGRPPAAGPAASRRSCKLSKLLTEARGRTPGCATAPRSPSSRRCAPTPAPWTTRSRSRAAAARRSRSARRRCPAWSTPPADSGSETGGLCLPGRVTHPGGVVPRAAVRADQRARLPGQPRPLVRLVRGPPRPSTGTPGRARHRRRLGRDDHRRPPPTPPSTCRTSATASGAPPNCAKAQRKMARRRRAKGQAPSKGYLSAKRQAARIAKRAARQNTHDARRLGQAGRRRPQPDRGGGLQAEVPGQDPDGPQSRRRRDRRVPNEN